MNESGRAAYERARLAEASGHIEDAARAYDELVAVDGNDVGAWSVRGLFLERQGRFAEACESFRHSTRIKPTYADHYNASRPHRALDLHAPAPARPARSAAGEIVRRDRIGGLIHEYERRAA